MPSRFTRLAMFGLSLAVALSQQSGVSAAEGPSARVLQYRSESGESVHAILLRAPEAASQSRLQKHVVLFDTSASQTGEHRQQALAVLNSFLTSLPEAAQVRLLAIDVAPNELTSEFVGVHSDAARQAVAKLERRAPLGATDLGQALNTAASLAADQDASIVYFGDGVSGLRIISQDDLQKLVARLREAQTPVNSVAIGPRRDLQLLGILSHCTGGRVMVDDSDVTADVAGRELAELAQVAPQWLTSLTTDSNAALLPTAALPVRSDRTTVVLGRGSVAKSLTGQTAAGEIRWGTALEQATEDNSYLSMLAQRVERNPLDVPFAGEQLLLSARQNFSAQLSQLAAMGDAALIDRDLQRAAQIGKAMRELDPQNANAGRLLKSAAVTNVSLLQDPLDPNTPTADPATAQEEGSLINEQLVIEQIKTDRLQLIVSSTIQQARQIADEDPDVALSLLKKTMGAVKEATDINPDVRVNLGKRLQGVLADVKGQKEVQELRSIRAQEAVAAIDAQKRLIAQLALEDDRIERLIDRVRSLIDEAARGNPSAYSEAEAIAQEAIRLRPGNGTATAARVGSEAAGQLYTAYYLRNLRADRFLATLEQVELSHVPFPDEPPIRWPAPEVWKALSERRAKYASVTLYDPSPSEVKIQAALDQPTSINFVEDFPLQDAVDQLSRQYEIPIILDRLAIEEFGYTVDEPLNVPPLSNITLRSALKIMLEELELTYIIEDEVMKITSIDVANDPTKLPTRVYPVGDLVIQLVPPAGGGGLGGLGGGGLGGGQQGGGFGGGQQGGGIGGGAFNIAPPKVPKAMSKPQADKAPAAAEQPVDPKLQNILNGILGAESASTETTAFSGFAQVAELPVPSVKKKP
ncbi:MAG: VWA domain-containing protein [Planctomycetota bacterium]